jgi:hypothetical protein
VDNLSDLFQRIEMGSHAPNSAAIGNFLVLWVGAAKIQPGLLLRVRTTGCGKSISGAAFPHVGQRLFSLKMGQKYFGRSRPQII